MDVQQINIDMAQMAVGKDGKIIRTAGIGSCIVITIYDPVNKVGGMAHAMLPIYDKRFVSPTTDVAAKYADTAITKLIEEMGKLGGNASYYKAKLIGGAKMFKILESDKNSIGQQNTQAAKNKLSELNITLESEDTGGTIGRSVEFDLSSGIVTVSTKM